jgi:hypothetical protein|tara:strand:- start:1357 stop:1575 length:219 start_codon:yes stop_codon:yes gene_type:complete
VTICNNGGFHYCGGEVGTIVVDSPAALERFNGENNADWQALMSNDGISIRLDLHVDLLGAINTAPGTPIARI